MIVSNRLSESDVILLLLFSYSPEPQVHSPNTKNGVDTESDVYKMLQHTDYESSSEPKQSGSFRYLQGILDAEDTGKNTLG